MPIGGRRLPSGGARRGPHDKIDAPAAGVGTRGWLEKRLPISSRPWRKTWCVLTGSDLIEYRSQDENELLCTVPLSAESKAYKFTAFVAPGDSTKLAAQHPCGFVLDIYPLSGKNRILFYYDTPGPDSLETWVDAINTGASRASPSTPSSGHRRDSQGDRSGAPGSPPVPLFPHCSDRPVAGGATAPAVEDKPSAPPPAAAANRSPERHPSAPSKDTVILDEIRVQFHQWTTQLAKTQPADPLAWLETRISQLAMPGLADTSTPEPAQRLASAGRAAPNAGDDPAIHRTNDEELFKNVLRGLEILTECDAMSDSVSVVGIEDSSSEDEEERRNAELQSDGESQQEEELVHHSRSSVQMPAQTISQDGLQDVVRRLRLRELPTVEEAIVICLQMRWHLRTTCKALERLPAPKKRLVIVGDIHGHMNDLLHLLDLYGHPSEENHYLFNGDFVDRGVWGPEVILFIFCLALLHPMHVHLNRGNHESTLCTDTYGFKNQLGHAFPAHRHELYERVHEAFNQLPLAHTIGDRIFVVHGGLPLHDVNLSDIRNLLRGPVPDPWKTKDDRLFQALLWSDPKDTSENSARGMGAHFSPTLTRRFLAKNGLDAIVRSHECVDQGVETTHDGLVTTVFSASNYDSTNSACVVIVNQELKLALGVPWNEPYITEHEKRDGKFLDTLQRRLGRSAQFRGTARERALEELHNMIYLTRPMLLEAFEDAENREGADEVPVGTVDKQTWSKTMATIFRTPGMFPWDELGPYLYDHRPDGRVAYSSFLLRYSNELSRWLSVHYCSAVLDQISFRLNVTPGELFARVDTDHTGTLSCEELRQVIMMSLGYHEASSKTQALLQSLHVFELFCYINESRTGFITKSEFEKALTRRPKRIGCEDQARQNFWKGLVHTREDAEIDFDNVSRAIRALCGSHCDVRQVFSMADHDRDGRIDQAEFVAVAKELLMGDSVAAEACYEAICHFISEEYAWNKERSVGRIPVHFLNQCLSVIDGSKKRCTE